MRQRESRAREAAREPNTRGSTGSSDGSAPRGGRGLAHAEFALTPLPSQARLGTRDGGPLIRWLRDVQQQLDVIQVTVRGGLGGALRLLDGVTQAWQVGLSLEALAAHPLRYACHVGLPSHLPRKVAVMRPQLRPRLRPRLQKRSSGRQSWT